MQRRGRSCSAVGGKAAACFTAIGRKAAHAAGRACIGRPERRKGAEHFAQAAHRKEVLAVEFDVEMKVVHCSNPEENPIPAWLRKKEEAPAPVSQPVTYPSFVRPINDR